MQSVIRITFALLFIASLTVRAQEADPFDAVVAAVRAFDNRQYEGKLYSVSGGNRLDAILQTPNAWGKLPSHLDWGHSNAFSNTVFGTIEGAEAAVDIATLAPAPDGYFAAGLKSALKNIAQSKKEVTVRILVGNYPGGTWFKPEEYLKALRDEVKSIPGAKLTIYVATARTDAASWNHSKIIAVDGRRAVVGGHNFWPVDYLGPRPVHDLSMRITGPAAASAHQFLDVLWQNVCDNNAKGDKTYSYKWTSGSDTIALGCTEGLWLPASHVTGTTRMFGIGDAGHGVVANREKGNPSETAIAAAFDAAKSTIRISQQDIGARSPVSPIEPLFGENIRAIARALKRKVVVSAVVSTYGAKAGDGGPLPYSTLVTIDEVRIRVALELARLNLSAADVLERMSRFHIVPIRFGSGKQWDNGWGFANHAKMFIIDDELFYIGSRNLYPARLQEYGYFVGNAEATRAVIAQYWEPLWQWSSAK